MEDFATIDNSASYDNNNHSSSSSAHHNKQHHHHPAMHATKEGSLHNSSQISSFNSGFHSLRPNVSTLNQETKRILRHRVAEETRQFVRHQTETLEQHLTEHNHKLRKKFEKHFSDKIRNMEKYRSDGIQRWIKRTHDSPYHTNQFQADAHLLGKINNVRAERRRIVSNLDEMDRMAGKPKHDIVTKDVLVRASTPIGRVRKRL
jgi:hypothetical protein